jgi:small redox-active disulfide protein 2
MSEVTRIRVGDDVAGIAGLKDALAEVVEQFKGKPAEQAGDALLEKLSKRNYIYPGKRELYRKAFVREYKKSIGEPVEETDGGCVNIKVFGPGCPRCKKMEEDVRSVLAETSVDADVEHVSDMKEILRTGIMGTPALMINDKLMIAGSVPPKARLKEWIEEAAGRRG